MMQRRFSGVLVVAAMAVAMIAVASSRAEATAMLTLNDGTTTINVTDQAIGDFNGSVGAVTWIGLIGVWNLNVSTGATYPVLGTASAPQMDLNSINTSTAAGTLTLSFTQTDFTGLGDGSLTLGGTQTTCGAGCTITYSAYWSATNSPFALTNPIDGNLFSAVQGGFSDTGGGAGPSSSPYSLTQVVTITRGAAGATSFDAHLMVPEPASMTLFGLGMLGFGVATRRRARRS